MIREQISSETLNVGCGIEICLVGCQERQRIIGGGTRIEDGGRGQTKNTANTAAQAGRRRGEKGCLGCSIKGWDGKRKGGGLDKLGGSGAELPRRPYAATGQARIQNFFPTSITARDGDGLRLERDSTSGRLSW